MSQEYRGYCSEYYIQFGGRDCSLPAPIVTNIYNGASGNYWESAPAELSGFCKSTTGGILAPGNIQISIHVNSRCGSGNAYTGKLSTGRVTSHLLVEEYCS